MKQKGRFIPQKSVRDEAPLFLQAGAPRFHPNCAARRPRLSPRCNGRARQRFASALRGGRGRRVRRAACSTPRFAAAALSDVPCPAPDRPHPGRLCCPPPLCQDETTQIVAQLREKCKRIRAVSNLGRGGGYSAAPERGATGAFALWPQRSDQAKRRSPERLPSQTLLPLLAKTRPYAYNRSERKTQTSAHFCAVRDKRSSIL